MAQSAPPIFARKATGLVREGSASSVLIYNINFVSIGLMLVFALIMIPAFYPGGNVQGTFLASFIVVVPTSLVFAMLAAAMPRSGGDYVYVSRILGPRWGMMSSFNNTIWWILYGGVPSAFFAYYGLTPLLRGLGILTNNATLVRYGNDLSTPTGAFIIGTLLIIVLVVIFATGLNFYFKIQNALFIVAMIGIAVTLGILLTTSHADFIGAFNHYIGRSTGHPDSYRAVVAAATHDGFQTAPFSLYWTLIPITWIYLELVFNQSSAYIGGEVRRPGRVQLWSMPVAAILSTGIAMIIAWQMARVVGTSFLGAASFNGGAAIGFGSTPVYTELVGYASRNVLLGLIVTFSFLFWSYSWLPGQILNASRNLLARHRRCDAFLVRTGQLQAAHSSQRAGRDGHRLHRCAMALHQADGPIQDADRHLRVHPELPDGVAGRNAVPVPATRDMGGVAGKLALGPAPRDHGYRGAELRRLRFHGLGLLERPSVRTERRAA